MYLRSVLCGCVHLRPGFEKSGLWSSSCVWRSSGRFGSVPQQGRGRIHGVVGLPQREGKSLPLSLSGKSRRAMLGSASFQLRRQPRCEALPSACTYPGSIDNVMHGLCVRATERLSFRMCYPSSQSLLLTSSSLRDHRL